VHRLIKSCRASDGAGVKLRRRPWAINFAALSIHFLMLTSSRRRQLDYMPLPVASASRLRDGDYILDGHMLHEDHLGNKGNLKAAACSG